MKFKIGMVILCLSVLSACDSGSNDPVVPTDPPKTVAEDTGVDNTAASVQSEQTTQTTTTAASADTEVVPATELATPGNAEIRIVVAPGHASEPARDNPLLGRYEGAEMTFGEIKYDEVELIQGPMPLPEKAALYDMNARDARNKKVIPNVVRVEGQVSTYQYRLPAGISPLEVQRTYEKSLKSRGFHVAFTCKVTKTSDEGCFKLEPGVQVGAPMAKFRVMLGLSNWPAKTRYKEYPWQIAIQFFFRGESARYLLMKRDGAEGADYVSIALSEKASTTMNSVGDEIDESTAFVRVVESKAMNSDKIVLIDASEMKKSLDETGRVNLYGIYFDTDKDTIKPESKPTLDEITKLMRDNKELRLDVVGHTDSTGSEPHNLDLSKRRAASVIRALAQADVDSSRFTSRGAGASEPVASNDTNEGRAKNRRVELVRM